MGANSHPLLIVLPLLVLSVAPGVAAADVVAVVSAKSPVGALSKSQVADIFLGRATRFPGGSVAVPIDQSDGTPAHDEFYTRFADKSPAQLRSHWAKVIFTGRGQPPRAVASELEVKKLLAQNPLVIAYVERSQVDATLKLVSQP